MSTPSTATVLQPPQFYSHHQNYQSNIPNGQLTNGAGRLYNGYQSGASNPDLRRTATGQTRQTQQLPPLPPLAPPASSRSMESAGSSHRKQPPDWNAFYAKGLPKEVIVIDDDDDEEEPAALPPPPRPTQPMRNAPNGAVRHTDKKRKTTTSTAYDPVYNQQQTSYSTTQTPYYDSPNQSTSTDRTTSALNTTAATSLGSQASAGQQISPLENGVVGQKRKRTRAAAQDEAKEAKRRELDHDDNPFSLYQPPPNPVVKAKDVYVQVVPDVRLPSVSPRRQRLIMMQKSYMKDQKVDDEDGHYIVVPDADLTERCK
jgi:dual-specificity kinase